MSISLLIHNFGFTMSALLSLSLGFFVLARGWSKKVHVLYFLTTLSFVFFCVVHLLAVNITDPVLSQNFFFLTCVVVYIVCFNAHFAFSAFGILEKHFVGIVVMYLMATGLSAFIALYPGSFIFESLPVQYLPNFLNSGPLYWLIPAFFLGSAIYFFSVLAVNFKHFNRIDQNRLKYFFVSFGFAYLIGSIQFLPVFGVDTSILPSALIGLYNIPLAYGLLKYDLIDLHVAARHAMMYFLLVCLVGFATSGVSVFNNYLVLSFEGFPSWPIPFFSGIIIVLTGSLVWRQIRQADALKYEFINNISHKFRTPLTHIRWMAEEMRESMKDDARNVLVDQIQYAGMRLFELTNAVIDASEDERTAYLYRFTKVHLPTLLKEILASHKELIDRKRLIVEFDIPDDLPYVQADKTRIQFALQIIFENALVYTPENGKVSLKARQIGSEVIVSCVDNGIGISIEDAERIFSKFYRSTVARHTDTEGMGIGLYMAKNIIEKHKGKIWVKSAGEGKGSEFSLSLSVI